MAQLQSFKPGDKIFHEEPWLHTINFRAINERCFHCLSKLTRKDDQRREHVLMKNNQCSGCKIARYCSKNCQIADWKDTHKLICPALPGLAADAVRKGESKVSDTMAIMLKILAKIADRPTVKAALFADVSDARIILQQHSLALIDTPERVEIMADIRTRLGAILQLTPQQLDALPPAEFNDFYTKMESRTLMIIRNGGERVGSGVYLRGANIPHSCVPNACQTFRGKRLTIVAMENITSIENVRVAYVDTYEPIEVRQEKLLRDHNYVCECPACSDPKKDAERFCLRCVNPDCDAKIPLDERASLPCPKCLKKPMCDRLAEFEETYETIDHPWMWSAPKDHSPSGRKQFKLQEKKLTDLLHPTNQLWPAFSIRKAIYMTNEGVKGGARYFLRALDVYRPLLSPVDPRIGICAFFAFQCRAPAVDVDQQEVDQMKEARDVLQLMFGENDDWVMEAKRRIRDIELFLTVSAIEHLAS